MKLGGALFGIGSALRAIAGVLIPHGNLAPDASGASSQTCTWSYNSNGLFSGSGGLSGSWVNPVSAAGNFWVYARSISGTAGSGTTDSWIDMSTNRSWSITQAVVGVKFWGLDMFMQVGPAQPVSSPTQASPAGSTFMGRISMTASREG